MNETKGSRGVKGMFNRLLRKKGRITREETKELEYEQTNVKEILTWMRDNAEYIVDLAYSAVILNSRDMAEEVMDIERKMDTMLYKIRIYTLFAGPSNFEEAEQLSGLLHLANAVESISDAAADIVDLFYSDVKTKPVFAILLREADEKIKAIYVKPGSDLDGGRIGDLMVESTTGVRILAIRRRNKWIYNIGSKTSIRGDDILIARGVDEGIREVEAVAEGKVGWGRHMAKPSEEKEAAMKHGSEGVDMLLELKNTSELMVDLALASLMYGNKELAEEVYILEEKISRTYDSMLRFTATTVCPKDPEFAVVLIKLINGMESIGDAARNIANILLRSIEPHPIIRESIMDSDVGIYRVAVKKGSKMDGKRLGTLKLASETGLWAFAIKRDGDWIFGPNEATRLRGGDILFVRGPEDGMGILSEWAGA